MVTEDYVSFETAKLLKEKGFDEKCFTVYNNDGKFYDTRYGIAPSIEIPAPTLQMAMKWLRKKHDKSIEIRSQGLKATGIGWVAEIYDLKSQDEEYHKSFTQPSFEQACDETIKYCCENLI